MIFLLIFPIVSFFCLFIKLNTDSAYLLINSLPLSITFIWLVLNRFKLSEDLDLACFSWVTAEWFLNYGKLGISVPVYLIYCIIDTGFLKTNDKSKKDKNQSVIFVLIYLVYFSHLIYSIYKAESTGDQIGTAVLNSSAICLFPVSFYVFCRRFQQTDCAKHPVTGIPYHLFFITAFYLSSIIQSHESIYTYKNADSYTFFPEFSSSAFLMMLFLAFNSLINAAIQNKHKLLRFLLAGISFCLLYKFSLKFYPEYPESELSFYSLWSGQDLLNNLAGHGYLWKPLIQPYFQTYNIQFPLTFIKILFLEGGLITVILTAGFFTGLIFKRKLNFRTFVLIALIIAVFYFPLMRDPISLLIAAFVVYGTAKAEGYSIKNISSFPADNIFRKFFSGCLLVLTLYFVIQIFLASLIIIKGPRYDKPDTDFQLSDNFIKLLLSSEDLLYFRHSGIDLYRLKKVILQTISSGEYAKGASSISMQLAKVKYLDFEKTFSRKIQQIIIGIYLELNYSKQEILKEYLASISYAPDAFGIVNASRIYFSKNPQELDRNEAMKLILSIPDPITYNPAMPISGIYRTLAEGTFKRASEFNNILSKDIKDKLH